MQSKLAGNGMPLLEAYDSFIRIMRRFVGDDYCYLILRSAVAGVLLIIMADTFARLVIAPVILPIAGKLDKNNCWSQLN